MGRTEPTVVVPPQSFRRDARSKHAKATLNKTIPALLNAYPRVRRGIDAAELIVDPPRPELHSVPAELPESASRPKAKSKSKSKSRANAEDDDFQDTARGGQSKDRANTTEASGKAHMQIRLQVADTLEAAARLNFESKERNSKRARIAVLNMASPLRPGGGFLNGATSQEESLCMRTTLYPSLKDEFYRLPEVGAIYTPDVLVFRRWDDEATELEKKDRFFVDVVSAGMLRFPDVEGEEAEEKSYANSKDRDMALRKMKAVVRVLNMKGADKVVLGAWGCGAYGNPVGEIARTWKKALLGVEGKKKGKPGNSKPSGGEGWDGLEVIFAIKDRHMARQFADVFGDSITFEEPPDDDRQDSLVDDDGTRAVIEEMKDKITEIEAQMAQARVPDLKARLGVILESLQKQLADLSGSQEISDSENEREDDEAGGNGEEEESGEDNHEPYELSEGEDDNTVDSRSS